MEILQKLRLWLLSYPGWGTCTLTIDDIHCRPGSAGLFVLRVQELDRSVDIHGNTLAANRLELGLRRTEDGTANSGWLLDFQAWVQQQSILGKPPAAGVLPQQEQIRVSEGKLQQNSDGSWDYFLKLLLDYHTYLEGVINDGSDV